MHPWIAAQANREHIAELRSLGRPFSVPFPGRGVRRIWAHGPDRTRRGWAVSRKRRISVRF